MVSPPLQSASSTPSTASIPTHPYHHRPLSQQQTFSALAEARAPSSHSHSRTHSTHSTSSPAVGHAPNGHWRQRSEAASGAAWPVGSGGAGPGEGAAVNGWDGSSTSRPHSSYQYHHQYQPQHSEQSMDEADRPISPMRSLGPEVGSGASRSHAWQAGMQSWPSHPPSALASASTTDIAPGAQAGSGPGSSSVAWHPSTTGYGAAPLMGPPPPPSSTPSNTSNARRGGDGVGEGGRSGGVSSSSRRPNGESSRDRRRRGRSRARDRSRSERRDKSRADKADREGGGGAKEEGLELGGSGSRSGRNREVRDRDGDIDRGERDRDKEGERKGERDREEDEVITTIFVVGFPDDMTEREFQNMFTFAPNFEAATLKHPPGTIRRDGTAALLDQLHTVAAARAAAAAAYTPNSSGGGAGYSAGEEAYMYTPDGYPINAQMEEALANLSLGGTGTGGTGGTASTSSATTPSAAISMTPSAPSGPFLGGSSGMGIPSVGMGMAMAMGGMTGSGGGTGTASAKRRQTIGFARFKTRQDALHAREVLQGKRIESLGLIPPLGLAGSGGQGQTSSSTLKAEMANKNLHAKRSNTASSGGAVMGAGSGQGGQGSEEAGPAQMRNGRLGGVGGMLGLHALQNQQQQQGYPTSGPAAGQSRASNIPPSASLAGAFTNGASSGSGSGQSFAPSSAVSAKEAWDAWGGAAPAGGAEGDDAPNSAIPIPRAINGFGPDEDGSIPPHLQRGSTSLSASTSASVSGAASAMIMTPSLAPNGFHSHAGMAGMGRNPLHPVRSRNDSMTAMANTGIGPLSPTLSASASTKSPNSRAADSKALLALAEEQDEMDWSIGMGLGMGMGMDLGIGSGYGNSNGNGQGGEYTQGGAHAPRSGYPLHTHAHVQNHKQNRHQEAAPLSPVIASLGSPTATTAPFGLPSHAHAHVQQQHGHGQSTPPVSMSMMQMHPGHAQHHHQGHAQGLGQGYVPGYAHTQGSDALSDGGHGMGTGGGGGLGGRLGNPADQNPPINTLYVGNLPAISPPTHPPSYLEDSLRALFQQSPGFKRMSFRQKINGPMCFVEYDDVGFATRAIRDLYGNGVNGLVKGGIRLSYSKNSLGQRGGSQPPPATLPLSLVSHHNHPHSPAMSTAIPTAMFTGLPQGSMSPMAGMGMGMGMGMGRDAASVMQQQQQYHAAQSSNQQQHHPALAMGQGQDAPSFSSLGLSSPPRTKAGESGSAGSGVVKEGGLSPTAAPFKIPTDPTSPRARFAAAATASAPRTGSSGSGSGSGSLTESVMGMTAAGAGAGSGTSYDLAQTPRSPPSLAGSMSGSMLSGVSGMSGLASFPPLPGSSSAFSPTSGTQSLPLAGYGNVNANGNGGSGSANHSTSGSASNNGSVGAMSPTFSPISPGGTGPGGSLRGGGVGTSFGGWVSSGRGSIGALGGGTW